MTHSTKDSRRLPGDLLLAIARLIFDEPTLSSIVCPAIADVQQELRDAGANRSGRMRARVRGYWAFCVLVAVAPFVPTRSQTSRHVVAGRQRIGVGSLILLVAALSAGTWSVFGWFMISAVTSGIFLAIAMRWWHNRHPRVRLDVDHLTSRRLPEINFSAVPVAGDVAGLIFAVGSVVVVLIGLPELRWFFLAAIISGFLTAAALFAWHRAHPSEALPTISIARR